MLTINQYQLEMEDEAIFIEKIKTLVLSDLHIGMEEQLRESGLEFPLKESDKLIKRIEKLKEKYDPEKIVFNGDFIHEFKKIPYGVDETIEKLMKLLNEKEVTIIVGSHDTMIKHAMEKHSEVQIKDEYQIDQILFTHGHKETSNNDNIELIIMGHEHPAFEVEQQRFSAYLHIKQKKYDIIVQPAFTNLARGVKINKIKPKDFMSPILKKTTRKQIHPIIIGDKPRKFPNLEKLEKHM